MAKKSTRRKETPHDLRSQLKIALCGTEVLPAKPQGTPRLVEVGPGAFKLVRD